MLGLLIAIGFTQKASFAQSDGTVYFPKTGHSVAGAFLQKFNEIPNPGELYGFPITEAFRVDAAVGSPEVWVQYFERARFEYHPDNVEGLQVILSNIGVYLHDNREPGEIVTTQPGLSACQYFSQSGYQICYAFLDYYNKNGGIQQFGYPISEVELQDGRMVQYFQRARFEWHPDEPSGKRVVLTDIGSLYLNMVEDPFTMQQLNENLPEVLNRIEAWAFVEKAVIGNDEQQTVYIVVKNQNFQAIENAQVTFTIDSADQVGPNYLMPPTNADGISTLTFPVTGEPGEALPITVTVTYEKLQKQTTTSFRVWW